MLYRKRNESKAGRSSAWAPGTMPTGQCCPKLLLGFTKDAKVVCFNPTLVQKKRGQGLDTMRNLGCVV